MKKTLLILSMITLIFAGCKKFDVIEASKVEIVEEKIEKGWDYIKIDVEYDYPVELESVTLYLSEKEDMSGAEAYDCKVDDKTYNVELADLKSGLTYYYCYEYDNGYGKEKSEKKNVKAIEKPLLVTREVSDVSTTSAKLKGSVTNNDGVNKITEVGFCWDTKQEPSIEGSHYNNGSMNEIGTSEFSYNLTSLQDNVTYYVRAYAKTNFGVIYGDEKSFKTVEVTLPTVKTNAVTDIKTNSATCGGNVTSDGNATVTARGLCWSTSPNPTINDNKTNNGSGTGSFTSTLNGLTDGTTYYVRAYATNEKGTSYGEQKSFTTLERTFENGYEYVDLGLSVKWATCNVGATTPKDYGNYYAWGETITKSEYNEDNCPTYGLSISQLQSQGYIDGDGNLTPSHDAATANWGGSWRMPTRAEYSELLNNCTWTWTTQNGVKGYKVTSKTNDNYIFLPAAGWRNGSSHHYAGEDGHYWSSTSYDNYYYCFAYYLGFYSSDQNMIGYFRNFGLSVRPVLE